jgi:hypothetical protein
MVILPLFIADPPGGHDAWHRVSSPGGYEFWQVVADDYATKMRFTAGFFEGHPSNAIYGKLYRAYRRHPTAHAPPLPQMFQFVEMQLARSGSAIFADVVRLPLGGLVASDERLELTAGAYSLVRDADRSLRLQLITPRIRAELVLRPQMTGSPPPVTREEGEYVFRSDPKCTVTGRIEIGSPESRKIRVVSVQGPGSAEHRWRVNRDR